jgi:7-carboxy-7-deazaguanine synthase (Cx14CxxC type)
MAKRYHVKEIIWTLQGEGANAGRPAVLLRFAGCNLWSGLEKDRATAVCQFCDTDFVGTDGPNGGVFSSPDSLAEAVAALWPSQCPDGRFMFCTGGEPLLQLDPPLIAALHRRGFAVAVETNGTLPAPPGIDWLTVSPKAGATLVQRWGHELKLVYPQRGAEPELYEHLPFQHFFLQPMAGPDLEGNIQRAVQYCLTHPHWRLSLQIHKILGIP